MALIPILLTPLEAALKLMLVVVFVVLYIFVDFRSFSCCVSKQRAFSASAARIATSLQVVEHSMI